MRGFVDDAGAAWSVTVGRESWGSFVLLFSPDAGGAARKSIIAAESALDAEQELDGLSEPELRQRLRNSDPWSDGP